MTGFSKLYLTQTTVLQFLLLLTRLFLSEKYGTDFLELVIKEEKQIIWYYWNTFVESAARKKTESVREFGLHWEVYIAWKSECTKDPQSKCCPAWKSWKQCTIHPTPEKCTRLSCLSFVKNCWWLKQITSFFLHHFALGCMPMFPNTLKAKWKNSKCIVHPPGRSDKEELMACSSTAARETSSKTPKIRTILFLGAL